MKSLEEVVAPAPVTEVYTTEPKMLVQAIAEEVEGDGMNKSSILYKKRPSTREIQ